MLQSFIAFKRIDNKQKSLCIVYKFGLWSSVKTKYWVLVSIVKSTVSSSLVTREHSPELQSWH